MFWSFKTVLRQLIAGRSLPIHLPVFRECKFLPGGLRWSFATCSRVCARVTRRRFNWSSFSLGVNCSFSSPVVSAYSCLNSRRKQQQLRVWWSIIISRLQNPRCASLCGKFIATSIPSSNWAESIYTLCLRRHCGFRHACQYSAGVLLINFMNRLCGSTFS